MPAVRGSTFGYETTTSNAGVVVPVCPNEANDLLIAVVMADTGSLTTFTATMPTGWKLLEEWFNTNPMIVYFKIASGSDTDLTIAATTHATTNETYNGSMTSFRDIDIVTPVSTLSLSSYSESNQDSTQNLGDGTTTGVAQSFTTPAATANTNAIGCFALAKFYLKKNGSPTGNITAKLYAHSGTLGTSSVPTGAALATSNTVAASTLTTSYQLISFPFPESNWFQFTANTNYVIALEYSGGDASNYVQVGYDSSSPSHGGNKSTFASAVWSAQSGHDCCFYANRFTFNLSNKASEARTNMPTISTVVDNSLVLYLGGNSGSAGTPSFIEGPISQIHASDGSAESHGLGWTFQKTAGTTPSTVYCSSVAIGASVKGVLQINPPITGATVIPPYCSLDNCIYIDPIAGTSAYNSNTALAATADTNFGTSLGGITANDATVSALTDKGINSFHSFGGLQNAATADQISGAELVLAAANRFNIGTKNLLCHVYPSLPADLQRFPSVSSNRGNWFGVRSNTGSGGATTGYKIWQVHGVNAPFDKGLHVPIIINAGAGNTKATSGTLDTAVIASVGFWTSGISTLQATIGFGSLWLMDSTIICGGNSSEPLTLEGIVNVTANYKERVSALLQGSKQILLLQQVQIGDGGTNPVYLNVDSGALEFPRQYNANTAQVNYNSIDDKCGISFYPGSSDTIIFKDTVVSSQSRYTFGLHASASTSATYDFSGSSVIGAGAISLNRAITITSLSINNYLSLNLNDADLVSCTITNVPATNDSVTSNSNTSFTSCNINVSAVTAGNRWLSVVSPAIFTSCTFTGGGGHAIRITTPGTYSLVGNTFTGFGANESTGAAIYNDSGGAVTLNVSGGVSSPTYRNGTSASTTVNNNVTITLTGLKSASEVRVYTDNAGQNDVVVDGVESSGTSFSFSVASSTTINIMINHLNYLPADIWQLSSGTSNFSIPISQFIDRQYNNP